MVTISMFITNKEQEKDTAKAETGLLHTVCSQKKEEARVATHGTQVS